MATPIASVNPDKTTRFTRVSGADLIAQSSLPHRPNAIPIVRAMGATSRAR